MSRGLFLSGNLLPLCNLLRYTLQIMEGQTLGHYTIREKLGGGGMGEVWLAEDINLDRPAALKLLPYHATQNEADKARFIQEAKAAARLIHPNIAQVYEIGEDAGRLYIAMEFIDGGSLRDRLDDVQGRCLPLEDILGWINQAADGLAEAHRNGVIHRDIKPDNLMITRSGHLKITDFGLAHLESETRLTASGATLGTVNYMSPEQITGREIDRRSDLFSLGATFYELLTGHQPFQGPDAGAIYFSILNDEPDPVYRYRRDISPALDQIISKLMAKDPSLRCQHADEIAADIGRLKMDSVTPGSRGSTSRRASLAPRERKPAGRNWRGGLIGATLVFAVFTSWYFGFGPGRSQDGSLPDLDPAVAAALDSIRQEGDRLATKDERALQTIAAYLGELSGLSHRVDSLQTLLASERSTGDQQLAGGDEFSPELIQMQAQYDSLMALLISGSSTGIIPAEPVPVNEAGTIQVVSPIPESYVTSSSVPIMIQIEPRGRVARLTIAVDDSIQVFGPTGSDQNQVIEEQITLGGAGRHHIRITLVNEFGDRSQNSYAVYHNPASARTLIGVVDFEANNLDEGEAKAITERFRIWIDRQELFEVLERTRMEEILHELGFQIEGACNTDEVLVQAGQILGAQYMAGGSISKIGSLYSLQVRLVEIATARVVSEAFRDVDGISVVLTDATRETASDLTDATLKSETWQRIETTSLSSQPLSIGVLDLDPVGVSDSESRAITQRLRYYLGQDDAFEIIERNQMESILNEIGFQSSGAANSDESVVQVGQILGVSRMVAGSITRVGTIYSIQIRIMEPASSRIEHTAIADAEGIEAVLQIATRKIAEELADYYR